MSQIDHHVAAVQNKMALNQFVRAAAWALLVYAAVVWLNVLIDRFFSVRLPAWNVLFWVGLGLTIAGAIGYAVWRRPSQRTAAVAIDEQLGLKEKFSTALYARQTSGTDPFAAATVRDAEASAAGVDLRGKFKLAFPRIGYGVLAAFIAVFLTLNLDRRNLLASSEIAANKPTTSTPAEKEQAKELVKKAIANVEQAAKVTGDDEKLELAKKELEQAISKADKDPMAAKRTALKAQQELQDAIKQKIKENQNFAQAQNNERMLRNLQPPGEEEKGLIADAHRDVAKGEFKAAVDSLTKAVENFDQMNQQEKEKAAQQMQAMANQLKKMADDPAMKKKMEEQLQQMGANQQQAQQMAQMTQQAAAGNPEAQQQLQQMQQQLQQQMNNGQGPNQQQQQQMQQMMQQMQAQANAQQNAGALAQAAQQMAQGMQQMAQGQQQQGQGQQQQQGQGQQQAQGQQQQQGQGQQQQGQGQQPGQGQQQMAEAQQQMQQQLQEMQQIQQDMQQMAEAQQAAQQGQQNAQNAMNGQQGQPGGEKGQGGQNQPGQGGLQAGVGVGNGKQNGQDSPPFDIQQEMSRSQENDKGQIVASRLVKAGSLKGEAKAELAEVAASAEQAQTDEVEQERITGQAREAQKKYFNSLTE